MWCTKYPIDRYNLEWENDYNLESEIPQQLNIYCKIIINMLLNNREVTQNFLQAS